MKNSSLSQTFCLQKEIIQNNICKNTGFILEKVFKYKETTEKNKRSKKGEKKNLVLQWTR